MFKGAPQRAQHGLVQLRTAHEHRRSDSLGEVLSIESHPDAPTCGRRARISQRRARDHLQSVVTGHPWHWVLGFDEQEELVEDLVSNGRGRLDGQQSQDEWLRRAGVRDLPDARREPR